MPEQLRDLDAILSTALKEAGERGLLEGVSDEDLARITIQARTKAAVRNTVTLENPPETTGQESWRKMLLHPENGLQVRDVLRFFPVNDDAGKKHVRAGHGPYWVIPGPGELWLSAIKEYFDCETPFDEIPGRFLLTLGELFEVVRPAESTDPTLGVKKKGLLRWKRPENNS